MGQDNNERTPLLKSDGCCGGSKTGACCGGNGSRATDSLAPVPLKRGGDKKNGEPVWPIQRTSSQSSMVSTRSDKRRARLDDLLSADEPLVSKCGASGGQCCEYCSAVMGPVTRRAEVIVVTQFRCRTTARL
jgi:hypothetical protein